MIVKKLRTPGNRIVMHKRRKKPSKHKCGLCGAILHGVPRGATSEIRKLTKSERRPARPFGGQLCSKCTQKILKLRAQLKFGLIKSEDIPISLRNYV